MTASSSLPRRVPGGGEVSLGGRGREDIGEGNRVEGRDSGWACHHILTLSGLRRSLLEFVPGQQRSEEIYRDPSGCLAFAYGTGQKSKLLNPA